MLPRLVKVWQNYRYRFVPWLSVQISEHEKDSGKSGNTPPVSSDENGKSIRIHHIQRDSVILDRKQLIATLRNLFQDYVFQCYSEVPSPADLCSYNARVMKSHLGFHVQRSPSSLGASAGTGVFVRQGNVKAGSIVAFYPGAIYLPSDPLFFASIRNQFIFRCQDGLLIDGNNRGLSKSIYKSCAVRDQFNYDQPCCDLSWITPNSINPLNIGQYINNENARNPHNVMYQELNLTVDELSDFLPLSSWRFLPNVWFGATNCNNFGLRLVPIIATRDIGEDEELFSAYFTVVHD